MVRKLVVLLLVLGLVFAFGNIARAATKNLDTGRYVFADHETLKPGLFVLDVKTRRYVDSGYAAYWAGLKAQEPIVVKAAADAAQWMGNVRTFLLYFPVTTVLGYGIELGNARGAAWTAADNWALANGKPSPFGCAAYAEFLSVPLTVANFPEGPALTLLSGPFYGFNRKLDILTGAGHNRPLLINLGAIAAKGTIFGLTASTGYHGFTRVASDYFHNALAWSRMTTIPGNILVNAGYGLMGKGIKYSDLFSYQNSDLSTTAFSKQYGTDFGHQYKAMSKFGQIVF